MTSHFCSSRALAFGLGIVLLLGPVHGSPTGSQERVDTAPRVGERLFNLNLRPQLGSFAGSLLQSSSSKPSEDEATTVTVSEPEQQKVNKTSSETFMSQVESAAAGPIVCPIAFGLNGIIKLFTNPRLQTMVSGLVKGLTGNSTAPAADGKGLLGSLVENMRNIGGGQGQSGIIQSVKGLLDHVTSASGSGSGNVLSKVKGLLDGLGQEGGDGGVLSGLFESALGSITGIHGGSSGGLQSS